MDGIGIVGVLLLLGSAAISFAVGRYFSRGRRRRKAEAQRAAAQAQESRQVRRARQRQGR